MKQLFTRIFSTNPFTTLGGLLAGVAVVLLLCGKLAAPEFLALIGSAVTVIGLASKDGVRPDVPVAREDVGTDSATPPLPPTGAAVVLLVVAASLFALAGCASQLKKPQAPLPAQYLVSDRLHVTPFSPAVPPVYKKPAVQEPVYEAAPDSLASPAPYLATPPAQLSKRERRQFLRAQRRGLIEASRTVPAKVKMGSGSSYAPAGTALAQYKPAGPTAVGHDNAATDNSKAGQHATGTIGAGSEVHATNTGAIGPPAHAPGWLARTWAKVREYGLVAGVVIFFLLLAALRFSPFGRGLRAAAAAARTIA